MKNFIEVNGKRYDSQTGRLIDSPKKTSQGSVDGIAPRHAHSQVFKPSSEQKKRPLEKSRTLLRTVVKKPAATKRAPLKTLSNSLRSPLVSKFGTAFAPVEKRVEPLMYAHPKPEPAENLSRQQPVVSPSESLIAKALSASTSHQLTSHKAVKRHRVANKLGVKPKTLRAGSAMLAFLVLGVFFAYQNVPNFAMRVASTRAGFAAQMPGYQPSGFAVRGPVQYKSGEVTVSFKSKTSDDRAFTLTQKTSDWNNDALLANVVTGKNAYQTLQDGNQTIYLYDGSNATWVKDGVWYQLEGNSRLTSDQISRLASSL